MSPPGLPRTAPLAKAWRAGAVAGWDRRRPPAVPAASHIARRTAGERTLLRCLICGADEIVASADVLAQTDRFAQGHRTCTSR